MFYRIILIILILPLSLCAMSNEIHIYQDADLSHHSESSHAIQKGVELAFDEINNEIQGRKVLFHYLDHRGNVVRSQHNYQTFINDSKALAIYSGIHSPPLIRNRAFINENKALTLVPWAAGGPITRYPSPQNWIFRLSIDDTQAGPVIIKFAVKNRHCQQPHLLLEDTPWGNSNLKSLSHALKEYNIHSPQVTRFSWNLKAKGARTLLKNIISKHSDCVILVGNAIEGAIIANEMANFQDNERLPIISHWGITAGDFHQKVSTKKREKLDLHFIQSCFSFTNRQQSDFAKKVFSRLQTYSQGQIENPIDLVAAVGFIHAYDLTKLLIQAIQQSRLTGNILQDRETVRTALENLNTPVQGLVKTYHKPFSAFDADTNTNAHEALQKEHYCMGRYGANGEILIFQQ